MRRLGGKTVVVAPPSTYRNFPQTLIRTLIIYLESLFCRILVLCILIGYPSPHHTSESSSGDASGCRGSVATSRPLKHKRNMREWDTKVDDTQMQRTSREVTVTVQIRPSMSQLSTFGGTLKAQHTLDKIHFRRNMRISIINKPIKKN